jgi:hypothetical protein
MAEGVRYLSVTVSPEHVIQRHGDLGARGDGLFENPVNILLGYLNNHEI